jgi:cytosine/adenosine deaminase-related metal-dependent hydrolase
MRSPHLDGVGDQVASLVLGANPADVEHVFVGGRIVKRDYKLVGSHVQKARDLMHESRKQVLERFQKQQSAAKTR